MTSPPREIPEQDIEDPLLTVVEAGIERRSGVGDQLHVCRTLRHPI
jgi:hypothetical protein